MEQRLRALVYFVPCEQFVAPVAGQRHGNILRGQPREQKGRQLRGIAERLVVEFRHQADCVNRLFRRLASHCLNPGLVVHGGTEPPTAFTDPARQNRNGDFLDFMMALDLVSYLPDDILVKVDRAAMGVSLETRVPLLDPRVIRYAWSLPRDFKVRSGKTKWALRQVLYRHVPSTLIDHPKKGFAVPIEEWLRGPLRDWAESLLDDALIRKQGVLEPEFVSEAWDNYLTGDNDATSQIWNMLMFQAWSQDGGLIGTEGLALQEV